MAWSKSAENPDSHVTLPDGSDPEPIPDVDPTTGETKPGVSDGVTTAGRVAYIALFVAMWGCMSFPIIYDIVIVTIHYVTIFTPKASNFDAIMKNSIHGEWYLQNVHDSNRRQDSLTEGDWNAWTIWNTAQLVVSFCVFVFYIYISIAIIIAAVDGWGVYDNTTALLN